jgi:Leucine-rich repeat (LRR) protein
LSEFPKALETLNCSNNNLKVLDGLEECPELSSITATDNMIAALGDLRSLGKLQAFILKNPLSSDLTSEIYQGTNFSEYVTIIIGIIISSEKLNLLGYVQELAM